MRRPFERVPRAVKQSLTHARGSERSTTLPFRRTHEARVPLQVGGARLEGVRPEVTTRARALAGPALR